MKISGFTHDRGACTTLRIKQPLERIKELGLADTELIQARDENTGTIVEGSDVLFLGRAASEQSLTVMRRIQSMGKPVVFDLDDNVFDVSVFSPHYKQLGVMPVNVENPDGSTGDVWKDGVGQFDVNANRSLRISFLRMIRQADVITVTNEPLVKVYRRYNNNVVAIPNTLNWRIWDTPPMRYESNEVRLLYTGAANHFEDWLFMKPVLQELQQKYGKKLKIVLIGTDWKVGQELIDYSQVEVHRWVDYEAYPYLLKSLCCDIGVAPVRESSFNECRSELKWVEYSALNIATVAKDWGPYKRSIRNRETGLLAGDEKEWFEALSRLIEDKKYRKELAKNANKHCRKHFNLDFAVDDWMAVFKEAKEKR